MATQAIRFTGPPGQTITLDVFTLASDTAEQSGLVCTEAENRKGLYTTANFTDSLSGSHLLVKKIDGVAFGSDFVELVNANGTYDAESARPLPTLTETINAINSSTTGTNAATAATEIAKVPRAATALTAGAAVERQIESPLGTAVQTIAEKVNGAAI